MYDILIAQNIETYFETDEMLRSDGIWFRELDKDETQTIISLATERGYSVTLFKSGDD